MERYEFPQEAAIRKGIAELEKRIIAAIGAGKTYAEAKADIIKAAAPASHPYWWAWAALDSKFARTTYR